MSAIKLLLSLIHPLEIVKQFTLWGGGGGGGSSGGTNVNISELPEWARGYAKNTLEKGAALTETPYQTYGAVNPETGKFEAAPRIAGFNEMQQQSQQDAANMQTSGATGAGISAAGAATLGGLNQNYQTGQFQNQFQAPDQYQAGRFGAQNVRASGLQNYQMGPAQQVGTQSFAQPGTAESYMSPYMQNVVNTQQREAQRASDIQGQQNAAQAVGQGAFGGSRQALVEAERQRNLATQKGDIQAAGQQAAFQNAQQQFNQEQAANLQAQQANQGAGLTTGQANLNALLGVQNLGAGQNLQAQQLNQAARLQAQQMGEQSRQFGAGQGMTAAQNAAQYGLSADQLGEQSRQFGANLGLQGLNTALQGASQLGSLGQQQFQQGMDINKLQNAYGGQQQALQQQGLDTAYQDFLNQQNYPYKQLGFMSDLIRGLPVGQQSTQQIYTPNSTTAQNVAALGAGAYGLSKFMAKGGLAYADGGSVKGYAGDEGSVTSSGNVENIVHELKSDQALQQALKAAQARGDVDEMQAVQNEMAMRASLRKGIAGGVTNQMAQRMAGGGGVLAFKEDGLVPPAEDDDTSRMVVSAGNKKYYDNAGAYAMEALEKLRNLKGYEGLNRKDREALEQETFNRIQKFGGEDPYAPMAEKLKQYEADRTKNYDRGLGFAALQAVPKILQGANAARGIAGGLGEFGAQAEQADKANTADQRALAGMGFNLADAQRKERIALGRESLASVKDIEANRLAAHNAERKAITDEISGASNLAKAYRPVGNAGAGAGGANKEWVYATNTYLPIAQKKYPNATLDQQKAYAYEMYQNNRASGLTGAEGKTNASLIIAGGKEWGNKNSMEQKKWAQANNIDITQPDWAAKAETAYVSTYKPPAATRLRYDAQGNQITD